MKKAAALLLVLSLLFSCASARTVAVGGGAENPDALTLSLDKAYSSIRGWLALAASTTE